MWLQHLSLKTFRNYKETKIDFNPKLNIFLGRNAQGKTNILEAIYFLALTRSHRTRSDKELIKFQQNTLKLNGIVHRHSGKLPLEIGLSNKGRITKVNHLKQAKLSDYIGHMTVVLFAPEDLQLVKGSPSLRRKFIDIDLGQIKPVYLSDLSSYNHVLKQRNAYLKSTDNVDINFLSESKGNSPTLLYSVFNVFFSRLNLSPNTTNATSVGSPISCPLSIEASEHNTNDLISSFSSLFASKSLPSDGTSLRLSGV